MSPCLRTVVSATALAASLAAQPVLAQDAETATDTRATAPADEIIVTARRREETLLDVPVAIAAVGAEQLERYAATDLQKIGQLVPQVILAKTGGGGAGASFTIRGLGSSALDAGIDQTVSLNIDGLQISRGRLVAQSFFDVQQVEVLKGPQALFFGKNSPGGVVSVKTKGATDKLEGYVRAGYEFKADERFVEGAISGPLTDTLGFRIAARGSKMSGYIDNNAGPITLPSDPTHPSIGAAHDRDPGTREVLGRFTLEWNPSSAFDATLKVFGDKLHDNGETSGTELLCDGGSRTLDLLSGTLVSDPYSDCELNGERTLGAFNPEIGAKYPGSNGGVPETRYESLLTSLTMNYRAGALNFTSVSGFWSYTNDGFDNFAFDSTPTVAGANKDHSEAFTQELRVNSDYDGMFNFAAGLFYEDGKRDTRGNGFIANVGTDSRYDTYHNWQLLSDNTGKTYSAFGQLIFDVTDTLELAGGARWTKETKRTTVGNSYVNDNFAAFGITADEGEFTTGRFSDEQISPEATITWRATPETTIYAAYKTGYKSGGFSNPSILSAGQTIADLGFAPEKADGGEVGFKGELLDRRLMVNATVYRYTFKGLQLTSFNPSPPSFTIRNAASARTTGVELDGAFNVTPEFTLRAAAGYNKAKYLSFPAAPCYAGQTADEGCTGTTQDLSGTPLVRAPKWNLTGGITYDRELTSDLGLGLSGDANYTSGYWLLENQNPVGWQKGFARLNATARLYQLDDNWELALIGRNLTNKYYGIAGAEKPFGTPDAVWVNIGRPREILLQGTVRF
ncbi:TonB-dependent receptor [Croceicoccus sp. BE223]|uniref:TonB-dependent receptor n=1 Tax=Croceicoccus sp. BE223 TaxID=2817716 RepID=UPI002854CB69|nr:TonB-dependent receptor [Croceicoccus sp. BE223]MDR7101376.1 outer membrane receptor protein involved in Fe transport [Croceicoccus sp. BE223]